jgi:hypothetical protein
MEKKQKLVDVFISCDGREFLVRSQCEEHELGLEEVKQQDVTQKMGAATMDWISENPAAWKAIEHRCLGLDDHGRTPGERMRDDALDLDPLDRNSPDFITASLARGEMFGILAGWWLDVRDGKPVPLPQIIRIQDLEPHENTMAHILARFEIFKSISEARKNGWNKPIETGDHWFKKKTLCVRITD